MGNRRTILTTLLMLFATGLILAMMAVLWVVGQDLLRLKGARADLAGKLDEVEATARQLRNSLADERDGRAKLAETLAKATSAIAALRTEATATQARLKALEEAPKRVDVTPPRPDPPPAVPAAPGPLPPVPAEPDPPPHAVEVPPSVRANPAAPFHAVSRAFQQNGVAGFAAALGLDADGQARFRKAHEDFLPQVRAAEKAHAKAAIEGDTVAIATEPYVEEGHALLKAWADIVAQTLPAAQRQAYAAAHGDAVLFQRPFGHYAEKVTLARDGMGVRFAHTGTRHGVPGQTFESAGTVGGGNAVDRLPWRHLLPDAAVAKLRGAAAPEP